MKHLTAFLKIAFAITLFAGIPGGCNQAEQIGAPGPTQMVGSGSWYTREAWPHDGNPYESSNFIVYSDAAGREARQSIANLAEELLDELIAEFEIIPEAMFRFPPGQDKIHIYAYQNYYPQAWGMRAYYGGLIAWSLDHTERDTNPDRYRPVLKHELVHVIESLLNGRDTSVMPASVRVQTWFSEGLAEAVSGGTAGGAIRGRDRLADLISRYGRRNPIAYKTDGVIERDKAEDPMIGFYYYYPMSQLAVEYLLDPDGLGKSLPDFRNIFLDMAEGTDFSTAFRANLGLSVEEYEAGFFEFMEGYLDEGSSIPVIRGLWAWVVLSAGSMVFVTLSLARNEDRIQGIRWQWLLVALLFGPIGMLCFLASAGRRRLDDSIWWRAFVASLASAAGNSIGLYLVMAGYHFLAPGGSAGPLILAGPFLAGWLFFRAPQARDRNGFPYLAALRRTFFWELISTVLVLGGMLPVLILLPDQFWFLTADPTSLPFWGLISLGALAGTLIVYPFSIWLDQREHVMQTNRIRIGYRKRKV